MFISLPGELKKYPRERWSMFSADNMLSAENGKVTFYFMFGPNWEICYAYTQEQQ